MSKILKFNEKKFLDDLNKHKSFGDILSNNLMAGLNISTLLIYLINYKKLGKQLALANFFRYNGKPDYNIQCHHLIEKINKNIISQEQYYTQRYYFKNIAILSVNDHYHNTTPDLFISNKTIKYILNRYFYEVA